MKIRIQQNKKGYYLKVNNLELGDYYQTIGYQCSGGRVYHATKDLAKEQVKAERNPRR